MGPFSQLFDNIVGQQQVSRDDRKRYHLLRRYLSIKITYNQLAKPFGFHRTQTATGTTAQLPSVPVKVKRHSTNNRFHHIPLVIP
ncbi:MAG: hypothetical protein KDE31_19145, partial [Caldilineaceae bacterium]|nr:hypothetical protein [Caldilineaceae bacterium]